MFSSHKGSRSMDPIAEDYSDDDDDGELVSTDLIFVNENGVKRCANLCDQCDRNVLAASFDISTEFPITLTGRRHFPAEGKCDVHHIADNNAEMERWLVDRRLFTSHRIAPRPKMEPIDEEPIEQVFTEEDDYATREELSKVAEECHPEFVGVLDMMNCSFSSTGSNDSTTTIVPTEEDDVVRTVRFPRNDDSPVQKPRCKAAAFNVFEANGNFLGTCDQNDGRRSRGPKMALSDLNSSTSKNCRVRETSAHGSKAKKPRTSSPIPKRGYY